MGDYIGCRKGEKGIEAFDILRDHLNSKSSLKPALLLGRHEHFFLRAMLNDFRLFFNRQILSLSFKSLMGPRAIDSLKNIRKRAVSN